MTIIGADGEEQLLIEGELILKDYQAEEKCSCISTLVPRRDTDDSVKRLVPETCLVCGKSR